MTPRKTKTAGLITKYYLQGREKLNSMIAKGGKVSLALDCWQSQNNHSFVGILGYWIDDQWRLQEHLLSMESVVGRHTGEALGKIVHKVICEYKLQQRLLAVTTDNASNNTSTLTQLSSSLRTNDDIRWDPKQNHIPCIAHTVQLVVKSMMEALRIEGQGGAGAAGKPMSSTTQIRRSIIFIQSQTDPI